ncbi:MAG: leucyl/phenylalanyl-tRNA--protein transferase [Limnoraphis robusta]|jgi:leucyl/phenylalanyl-tRNA--protein transferase|uniref:Leucyl/phenylalanyl-tRNA--protein transferase n=2 Tax=Limnoraphis robusta TaxID=1118279 RepID=A0A0F5Y6V7_9CYAN|nr:leucyl/phenylalanyl-tRNA--protein transferase [Limnoraphis robusta]MCG5060556.1 leucyl/phenylalanyl-tRNA--protein transferase [Limnoraphis sp. WC205]KKD34579.1 leucyl/phenylalanyl-tRNA--protein transferase [Limnoraphis robusta CS-951]MEA5499096.1 leucyl/phenylalanyl-tRNA--protein transferase [Limnoraphis robusta BA-68 BA1]MEA5520682.1 leucyl/phenylalanyl-tRNA--protein transferase [Limnoraphis robusta CCNP1315]MEA5542149.1 leucyl/phenylalanyl-tRNA--protein transferase [Limnoraphis robusta Ta
MQYDVAAIIQGYAQGYFLMADEDDQNLGWYTSRQRALIPLDERFRYPRSLQRVINQNRFSVAVNRDFNAVVEGCANRETTWISSELKSIYYALYRAGYAYSFETWQGDQLAGGILGLVIGGAFIGESMFYRIPEGSKVAMVKLVERLRERNFVLFDAQMNNPHLDRFGAYIISHREYKNLLNKAWVRNCSLKEFTK